MKNPDIRELIRLRGKSQPILMSWHSLGTALAIEIAGKTGFDAVLVDQQHGVYEQKELIACFAAAHGFGQPALTRVRELNAAEIGQALDMGAQGVVCPMINSASDAKALVEAVKFPPLGSRSFGPFRAKLVFEGDYFLEANNWTIACAQIETKQAIDNLEEILKVEGLDMILVGPNDLAISLNDGKSRDITTQNMYDILESVMQISKKTDKMTGIFANNADYAKTLVAMGWDMIAISTDASLLEAKYRECLSKLSHDQ